MRFWLFSLGEYFRPIFVGQFPLELSLVSAESDPDYQRFHATANLLDLGIGEKHSYRENILSILASTKYESAIRLIDYERFTCSVYCAGIRARGRNCHT